MKEKTNGLITWGVSSFQLVIKNKLVVSGMILVQGIYHVAIPEGVMAWDAKIISASLALYALVSLVLTLTNSEKAQKGQEVAGGLVKGLYGGKKRTAAKEKEILRDGSVAMERADMVTGHRERFESRIIEKHQQARTVSKIIMIIFYAVILAVSVFMFIRSDIGVHVNHFFVGLILIVEGVLSIMSVYAAKETMDYKSFKLSIVLSLCSVILGGLFIFAAANTGVVVMRIIGITLILKAIGEFIVAFRNREILSTAKDIIRQVKEQKPTKEETE